MQFGFIVHFDFHSAFIDDRDLAGKQGGTAYTTYGIDPSGPGVAIVVRPDGYVGTILPLDQIKDIALYFNSFLKPR